MVLSKKSAVYAPRSRNTVRVFRFFDFVNEHDTGGGAVVEVSPCNLTISSAKAGQSVNLDHDLIREANGVNDWADGG